VNKGPAGGGAASPSFARAESGKKVPRMSRLNRQNRARRLHLGKGNTLSVVFNVGHRIAGCRFYPGDHVHIRMRVNGISVTQKGTMGD
jgi:hypothetical protein